MTQSRMATGARDLSAPAPNVCAATDIGYVRTNNEDRFYVEPDATAFAVADGLGGLPAGEVAAEIAISVTRTMLQGRSHECRDEVVAMEMLADVFRAANSSIRTSAEAEPGRHGMATTLVVGLVAGATLYVSHVGDVRAYRFGNRGLERLTNDHTTAWELVDAGVLTEEEARIHPYRNSLTRVLGLRAVQPSFCTTPLNPGDVVLLCSDGLWEPVGPIDITAVLAAGDLALAKRATRLLDRALEAGGPDNITLALYEHEAPASRL